MIWTIVAIIVIAAIVIPIYNKLVALKNRFKNAFSQIDVQMKRRYDLIPNLVEAVQAFMAHEKETLEKVIAARNHAVAQNNRAARDPADQNAMEGLIQAEVGLAGALANFFAVSEAYPDLKSNENMQQLQEELTSTENRIAFARQAFNDAVMRYNTAREVFPNNIIAGTFSFKSASPFEITQQAEREGVQIRFDLAD